MKRLIVFVFATWLLLVIPNGYADDMDGDAPDSASDYPTTNEDDYSRAFPEPSIQESYSPRSYSDDREQPQEEDPPYQKKHVATHAHADLPDTIPSPGEPVIIVNPRIHAWGAYSASGELLHSGLATAGSSWCEDLGRPCRTKTGTFRIYSLGSEDCYSKTFPLGEGGAPMPYCMYFNGGQGIHGSNELAYANLSHGCVRVSVDDARWLRFNFSHINTKVIVEPY